MWIKSIAFGANFKEIQEKQELNELLRSLKAKKGDGVAFDFVIDYGVRAKYIELKEKILREAHSSPRS